LTIAAIEGGVPLLAEARETIAAFHVMVRTKAEAELDAWIERARQSRRILRQRRHERQGRCSRRDYLRLVKRTNRGTDHQAKARKTPNVWARETRSARSATHRRKLIEKCTKSASEPELRAT
jgi:hypothetical protein